MIVTALQQSTGYKQYFRNTMYSSQVSIQKYWLSWFTDHINNGMTEKYMDTCGYTSAGAIAGTNSTDPECFSTGQVSKEKGYDAWKL